MHPGHRRATCSLGRGDVGVRFAKDYRIANGQEMALVSSHGTAWATLENAPEAQHLKLRAFDLNTSLVANDTLPKT